MSQLDDQIRDALQAHQVTWDEDEDLENLYEAAQALFRGQQRWLTIYLFCVGAVLLSLAIVCAVQFFQVESTRAMIAWAIGFVWAILGGSLIELCFILWFFMERNKYVIRREIKLVELQVAALASGIRTRQEQQGGRAGHQSL